VLSATVLLFAAVSPATAQEGQCQVVDSVVVEGAQRLDDGTVLTRAGITAGGSRSRNVLLMTKK
ncbi:MAG: hypothetical protein JSV70_05680, partial [bacterium]